MRLYVNKIPKINFCYFWLVCYSVWLKTDSLQKRSKWTNFKSLEICANVVKLFQRFQVLFKFMNLWFYIWNFHQVWMVQNFTLKIYWYFIIDGCWLVTLKFFEVMKKSSKELQIMVKYEDMTDFCPLFKDFLSKIHKWRQDRMLKVVI